MPDIEKIRKDVEYLKPLVEQIENQIVSGSEDFFDTPRERSDLHVSIRIACEFHKFMSDFPENPPESEVWVMDTMRSGLDQLWLLARSCHLIADEYASWNFNPQVSSSFSELRIASLKRFEDLVRPEATAFQCLRLFLRLDTLRLFSLDRTFP